MSRQHLIRLVVVVAALGIAGAAHAKKHKHYKYLGGHPLHGDVYCYIEAPHVHIQSPGNKRKVKLEYRVYDDHHHFVGDPVAHGYDGDTHTYYGHHPIALDVVAGAHVEGAPHTVVYCYLNGPHFHAYAPPPDITFEVKGDAYWYVGEYPREYERNKPVLIKINPLYARVEYERPVVEVDPPTAYVGPIVEVHAAPAVRAEVAPGHAEVRGGLEVDVHIPTPTLEVEVGVPGVVVVDDHHHHRKYKRHKHKHRKYKHKKYKRHKKHRHRKRSRSMKDTVWRRR